MTSTDRAAALIRKLHAEEIVPLAARLAAEDRPLFPLGPDPQAASYYEERRKKTMEPADFEIFGPGGPADLEPALVQLWTEQGWPELAPLAPAVAEIARAVRPAEDGDLGDGEVSPFLYAMF